MFFMKVKATQLIDDRSYPEIVLCEIIDVNGYKHKFKEKWPILSNKKFDNIFPKECSVGCTILEEKMDSYIVSTLQPWAIESIEGKSFFEIRKDLLFEING